MAYTLTVGGYQFENPPEEYRKLARLSNSPQTAFNRSSAAFYQSDSQNLQFQVEGTLALDPALGGSDDLAELERLQSLAIDGGEVDVEFNPFFSGKCVIEDDPFRQSGGESDYAFTFTVNSESTDSSAYPAHSAPDTGNTFEFGDLDLGYDPNQVAQNYEKQTEQVKRLQGVARSVDTDGLVPKVTISGMIDGSGQATLWDKARANTLAFLSAEFQNGWCLVDSLSIRNSPEAPDYLQGLFQYDLDVLIVMDPSSGIGEVSKYVDRDVQDQSTYVSNCDEDGIFERYGTDSEDYPGALDYRVSGGTGKMDGDYIEWSEEFGTLEASTTNYLWVADGDGDGYGSVNEGTSGFPGNTVPLYEIDTGSSSVNDIRDQRSCLTGTRLSDDERGDLNFMDSLSVSDQLNFERVLAASDVLAISDVATFTGQVPLPTQTPTVDDSSFSHTLTTVSDSVNTVAIWDTESQWHGVLDRPGFVADGISDHPGGGIAAHGYDVGSLSRGLVGYWPLDEGSGSIAGDATELSNDGTITGATWNGSGQVGSDSLSFDGIDDKVDLSTAKNLPNGSDPFTISAHIKHVSVSSLTNIETMVMWGNGNTGEQVDFLMNTDGTLRTAFFGSATHGGTSLSDGAWHHVVTTYDGNDCLIYVDGVQDGSNSVGGMNIKQTNPAIGYRRRLSTHSDDWWEGIIDDVRIYDRSLSTPEIQALANRTATSPVTAGDTL